MGFTPSLSQGRKRPRKILEQENAKLFFLPCKAAKSGSLAHNGARHFASPYDGPQSASADRGSPTAQLGAVLISSRTI